MARSRMKTRTRPTEAVKKAIEVQHLKEDPRRMAARTLILRAARISRLRKKSIRERTAAARALLPRIRPHRGQLPRILPHKVLPPRIPLPRIPLPRVLPPRKPHLRNPLLRPRAGLKRAAITNQPKAANCRAGQGITEPYGKPPTMKTIMITDRHRPPQRHRSPSGQAIP